MTTVTQSSSRSSTRPSYDSAPRDRGDPAATEPLPAAPHALARGTGEHRSDPAELRVRARGTPHHDREPAVAVERIRALIYAPEPERERWIESALARSPTAITIQVGRKVRTVVAALVRDPPPRPEILIVDFDAVSPGELLELHAIRDDGWFGRLIGLGRVPDELRASLGVDRVLASPLVGDELLDCVAGTRHAAVTTAIGVIPDGPR
jgi:hypothetical protein